MSSRSRISGPRESSAGDDFHVLWAARRALALLDPKTGLQLIRVEGPPPDDVSPESDELFLGMDMIELHGGRSLANAETIVASQLKYATRHPHRVWSAARLAAKSGRRTPAIRRLAQVYKGLLGEVGRESAVEKTSIRLVSNRPVAATLLEALNEAQRILEQHPAALQSGWLERRLAQRVRDEITRLRSEAGLSSTEFTDFLRILDLSECGAEPRAMQRLHLSSALARHVGDNLADTTRVLYDLVWQQMMPEAADSPGLTRHDVIAALSATGEDQMFPSPPVFQLPEDPLPTPDTRAIAAGIVSGAQQIVAYGAAGVGKTTSLLLLERNLPPRSIVIAYDCFGGGEYLSAGEARHTEQRAVFQLINEISVRCGTPLLVQPPVDRDELWRRLRRTLEDAAGSLMGDQCLVLAIDAADNSVIAGEREGQQSFVRRLWQLSLPRRSHLVMTVRTHRRDLIEAPVAAMNLELIGFDEDASLAHLQRVFPSASAQDGGVFHTNTSNGNPRTQFYALDEARSRNLSLEDLLDEAARTPEEIFSDLVNSALDVVKDRDSARNRLALLMAMARPISLAAYARITKATAAEARRFSSALVPGLVIEGDMLSFRDEDFEAFVADQFTNEEQRAANSQIADALLIEQGSDSWAARFVADHLRRAGRSTDLIQLALEGGNLSVVEDAVARSTILFSRLKLALEAASAAQLDSVVVRLLLLAAQAVRSESALTSIVQSHPELAMRFGDPEAVAAIYLREDSEVWRGPAHARVAAMYARHGLRTEAEEQLALAEAWLRRRSSLDKNDLHLWDIEATDVARVAECLYFLCGLGSATTYLGYWLPNEFRRECIWAFGRALAAAADPNVIREEAPTAAGIAVQPAVLAGYWERNESVAARWVKRVFDSVVAAVRSDQSPPPETPWAIPFCELAAASGCPRAKLLEVLGVLGPEPPQYAPSEWDRLDRFDLALRRAALVAALTGGDLRAADLTPDRLGPPAEPGTYDRNAGDRRSFIETFERVVPAYALRAKQIVGSDVGAELTAAVSEGIASATRRAQHRWFKHDGQYDAWCRLVADVARRARAESDLVAQVADSATLVVRDAAYTVWLGIAEVLGTESPYSDLSRRLIEDAALFVLDKEWPATEKSEALLRCATAAEAHDDELARSYYERAAEAASGIDDEGARVLKVNSTLAVRAAIDLDHGQRRELAQRLQDELQRYTPLVSTPDRLPRDAVAAAVARIDPPAAIALASRWDDQADEPISASIGGIAVALVDSGYLTPREGVWLLRLIGEDARLAEFAIRVLTVTSTQTPTERVAAQRLLEEVSIWIRRDLPTADRERAGRSLLEWASARGLSQASALASIQDLVDFAAETRQASETQERIRSRDWGGMDDARADAARQSVTDGASSADLDVLCDRLAELTEGWGTDDALDAYLKRLADAITPQERVTLLDRLAEISLPGAGTRLHMRVILANIRSLLDRWRTLRSVEAWAPEGIARFARIHVVDITAYEHETESNIRQLFEMPLADRRLTTRSLAVGAGEHLDEMGSRALYDLAEALGQEVEPSGVLEVLPQSLPALVASPPELPDGPAEVLALFLWGMCGHPDKVVRWRAVHVARALLAAGDDSLLAHLLALWKEQEMGAFKAQDVAFYWLSAQQWLALLVARVAAEQPDLAAPHFERLVEIAEERDFPHVAAREMMRCGALLLAPRVQVTEETLERLRLSNRPTGCLAKRELVRGNDRRNPPNLRFEFDPMDTLPYWFSGPARIFGMSSEQFAALVEPWIVDRLGFGRDDWWKDRRELSQYQYEQTSRRQGTFPRVEILRAYLEYHGMMLAAGQLVDERRPALVSPYDDDREPWGYWLASHIHQSADWWLADLRDPTPLESEFYGNLPDEESWKIVSEGDFERSLGLREGEYGQRIVVASWISLHDRGRYGSNHVRSALVSPGMATSLVAALQTDDGYQLGLPKEDDSEWDSWEIDEGDFRLIGWLRESRDWEGSLDERDPLARIRRSFTIPGLSFAAELGLAPDPPEKVWRTSDGAPAIEVEAWSDEPLGLRDVYYGFTDGWRTWVDVGHLLTYLRKVSLDLLIDVHIDRHLTGRREEGAYDPGQSQYFLLRQDGRLETHFGSRPIGAADH
jgi:hypothetical protein